MKVQIPCERTEHHPPYPVDLYSGTMADVEMEDRTSESVGLLERSVADAPPGDLSTSHSSNNNNDRSITAGLKYAVFSLAMLIMDM